MSTISVPPELFPIIASFIPLRSAPQTLLSLCLTNHHLYDIVHPLLYSRLVLRSEDDAIAVMQHILRDHQLGMAVTELYIMSELSTEARAGKKPFDIAAGLRILVEEKLLPRLVALGIYLLNGWEYNENWNRIQSNGRLPVDIWKSLRTDCPRLRSLYLRNLVCEETYSWLPGPVVDEILNIEGLSALRLEWRGEGLETADDLKVLNHLPRFASSLHTLSLKTDYQDIEPILSTVFPCLTYLHLRRCIPDDGSLKVTDFFRRHPQLEYLGLETATHSWFPSQMEAGFLPNLKHLKGSFDDIRHLTAILPQLTSLAFTESYNCQVPYLIREIIPNGLPGLKSLEIHQQSAEWDQRKLEGVLWYETKDGQFRTENRRKKIPRNIIDDYLHSIVRGAPNLDELGLHGLGLCSETIEVLGPTLAQLKCLKRFYYRGFAVYPYHGYSTPKEEQAECLAEFLADAETLARFCRRLESVTSISSKYLPYISGVVERDSVGEVIGVRQRDGVGLEIPVQENDPFPVNT